ncbi:MAG TPA: hypothetical protein VF572_06245 [Candidatus Saccharimonadales bacterium]|jgi:hypothetical protein
MADSKKHRSAPEAADGAKPELRPAHATAPLLSDAMVDIDGDGITDDGIQSRQPAAGDATPATTPPVFVLASDDKHLPPLEQDPTGDRLTDALVDDIVIHESDQLLDNQDKTAQSEAAAAQDRQHEPGALRRFFGGWWHNRLARYATLLVVLAGLGALAVMPTSRYYALNTAGVRSAASLTIVDNTTQQPLKNVAVELGQRKARTNQDGLVKLSGLELGPQALTVSQAGFATISRTVTLGYGSNPLGEFTLEAVGVQFRFSLTDYLTGKSVTKAEISSGDSVAQADDKGHIVLTVGEEQARDIKGVASKLTAPGYRAENITLDLGVRQSRTVVMVPDDPEIFISKQSGKYDLYRVDIDGKNKQLLLAGTGKEDADITVVPHLGGDVVALVSKRDSLKNQDGFPLQALTLVDVSRRSPLVLDHSERIQIVDWIDDKLVYVKIKAGTSAGNPERYQLMSYDFETTARVQLAAANNFNDVVSAQGDIYYAASNNFQGGESQFVRIRPDNTGKMVLLDKTDIWNITRTTYDDLTLAALQGTYSYRIGDTAPKKDSDKPTNVAETRFYLDAIDGKQSLWTESRDGKGVLLAYDAITGKDKVLATQSGLSYPVHWLNHRTAVYRVTTPAETADYVVSLDGGAPKKITDLTNTVGLGKWNYR